MLKDLVLPLLRNGFALWPVNFRMLPVPPNLKKKVYIDVTKPLSAVEYFLYIIFYLQYNGYQL